MEFGPYIYQEHDSYTNLTWTTAVNPASGKTVDVVNAIYNQRAVYVSDSDGYIDTKMYQINQVGRGFWWGSNNSPSWRIYISLLYSLVLDGLGYQV